MENADAFPLAALQAVQELRAELEAAENAAILRARELGASLEDVADVMGMTRQGVAYRLKALRTHQAESDEVVDLAAVEEENRPRVP